MTSNRDVVYRSLRMVAALASLAAIIYLGRRHWERLDVLLNVQLHDIAGLSGLFLLTHVVIAACWDSALRSQGRFVNFTEQLLITFLRAYLNLLLPWAGAGAVAVYMKKRAAIPYSNYLYLQWELTWISLASLGTGGVLMLTLFPAAPNSMLYGMILLVAGSLLMVYAVRLMKNGWLLPGIVEWLRKRTGEEASPLPIARLFLMTLVNFVVRSARTWLLFVAIGSPITLVEAVLLTVAADLAVAINITPNGLGIREAAISVAAAVLGHDPGIGVAAAVLDRVVFTFWIVVFGQLAIWKLDWKTRITK